MSLSRRVICGVLLDIKQRTRCFFFFQAEDGIRDLVRSRGLGDVYKRQPPNRPEPTANANYLTQGRKD